jgi:formylglycine-generating enzyme required for sulfatase activity
VETISLREKTMQGKGKSGGSRGRGAGIGMFLLLALLLVLGAGRAGAAEVKEPRAERDGDVMVFSYDLVGAGREEVVSLTIRAGGKEYASGKLHLKGDVGKVKPGKGKVIRWQIREDFPGGLEGEPVWELKVVPKGFRDPVTGMEFVRVTGGCYSMGDGFGVGTKDELPLHKVCLSDYYIGKYEVTQGEWLKVMGNNPSFFKKCGERCPVDSVSWKDVDTFLEKLVKLGGKQYRLPTEAEWEYAARGGGKKVKWAGTGNQKELKDYALYADNSANRTRPVGRKRPNALGIYDMSGSVWEWVGDYYDAGFYRKSPSDNPTGPERGLSRVQRGGAWNSQSTDLRVTKRVRGKEGVASLATGFRLVLPSP